MDYEAKLEKIVKFIKSGEKDEADFRVGFEAEHFIIDKDSMETLTYFEEGGIRESLEEIEDLGYEASYEGENIMGLSGDGFDISIEPAAQFEVAFNSKKTVDELFEDYKRVMAEIVPIFDKKDELIAQVGYQPKTKIENLPFIPKERYKFMSQYFTEYGGSSPFNMMKGSASLQVAVDYKDEEDFMKKFFVANAISTFLYTTFDNAYIFEGEVYEKHNLRQSIWDDCDKKRSGMYDFAFDRDLSYKSYAKKILDTDGIFYNKDGEDIYTGNKKLVDMFDEDSSDAMVNHALSIVFPDVRVKTYIEVRMPDNVAYPYNFAAVALIKNIFYDKEVLDYVYEILSDMTYEVAEDLKEAASIDGLETAYKDKKIYEWMLDIISKITEDREYIDPIKDLLEKQMTPRDVYEKLYKENPQKAIYEFSVNKFIKEQLWSKNLKSSLPKVVY